MPVIQNLIAEEFGSHVGKYSGRLKVTKGKEVLAQAPLIHLESVTIINRGVSISADAINACTEKGIPIHFVSGTGRPFAALYSSGLTGTVLTRRAQLEAYNDLRSIWLAAGFVQGKIENQAALLKYVAKYRKETAPETFQELRLLSLEVRDHLEEIHTWIQCALHDNYPINQVRFELLSIEGRAAQKYWKGIRLVLPDELEWPGRLGRGARDRFNTILNYGYGVLYGEITRALVLAGLDPYGGYLHADRPGKPSLTLDLIEEFRQPVVDKTMLGLVNRGVVPELDERGYLTDQTRKMLAEKVLKRLDSVEKYAGKKFALRHIIQKQARQIATYVRNERVEYNPFYVKW
jgi:CRISPR-associated protein Cas1